MDESLEPHIQHSHNYNNYLQTTQYFCFIGENILKSFGIYNNNNNINNDNSNNNNNNNNINNNNTDFLGLLNDEFNFDDRYDYDYSNIDSNNNIKFDINFKESFLIHDYLNHDNSDNYNDGVNKKYNSMIIADHDKINTADNDDLEIDTDDDDDDNDDTVSNYDEINKRNNDVTSDNNDQNNDISHQFIIRPDGLLKKIWEVIGLVLLLWQLYDVITGRYHHWLVHPIMDTYFIIDIILRFRTGYVDHNGRIIINPDKIRRRYLRGSFLIDLIISLPYGLLSNIWKNRPITKLVEIKSRFQVQPKKNIMLNLLFNRPFRLEVVDTIKDHLFERKYYKAFREATGIGIPIMPDRQKKPIQWIIRRTARILGFGFRIAETFKIVAYYSVIAKNIQGVAFGARSIIVLWPMLREKVRPMLLWKKVKRNLSMKSE